jgi:hypothetical protein
MSSLSPSDIRTIEILSIISHQLNRYFTLFIFLFGLIGNILNTLVLSQRTLRTNPCILLFLISSISNLISILFGLTARFMSGWDADLTDTHDYHCKLRAFIMFTSRTIAFWLIMLATTDRWLLSSNNIRLRQLSSLKNAQRGTSIIVVISILLYLHMFYCYEANLIDTPLKCYGKTASCRLLTDMTYACITISLPLFLMLLFGFMTIRNISNKRICMLSRNVSILKKKQTNILVVSSEQKRRWKKLDRYLHRMLFFQVMVLILLTFPQTIHKLYSTLSLYKHKTLVQYAIDRFLYNFDLLLTYLASGMPFYIYTLSGGKIFRNALKNLIYCNRKISFCK